jgi:hypothetical protein
VLRFDFDGTGDSAGDERDPARVATWRGDVGRAAAELRARSGRQSLALVGLKLGATFAMLGAEELGGVDALVLWGAFETGTAFVKEVTRAHKMHTMLEPQSFSGGPPATDGQEALGFLLTASTIQDLGGVNLLTTTRSPARRTLVIDTGNVAAADSALLTHLRELGGQVTHRHLPGQKFLITSPQYSEVPMGTLSAITEWLTEVCPPTREAPPVVVSPSPAPMSALHERPVTFGRDKRLFGILAPSAPTFPSSSCSTPAPCTGWDRTASTSRWHGAGPSSASRSCASTFRGSATARSPRAARRTSPTLGTASTTFGRRWTS